MEQFPVNPTDAIVVLVVVISGLIAFLRGFVREVLGLLAWIGAGIVTIYAIDYAIPVARDIVENQAIADIGAGVVLFIVALIVLSVVTKIISDKVRKSSLGTLDRSLGLVFGVARGAVLVCLAWLLAVMVVPPKDMPPWITEARSLPVIKVGAERIAELIPPDLLPEDQPDLNEAIEFGSQNLNEILQPKAKESVQDDATGYNDDQREGMDRLQESVE